MKERDVRNKAKVWIIKNNHNLKSDLKNEGLVKVLEDAFIAGAALDLLVDLQEKYDILQRENERFEEIISDLQEEVDQTHNDLSDAKSPYDISVEHLR